MALDEDDLFEDAGDLDFYDKSAPGNTFETLYLARIPKYMWDAWIKLTEKMGDDEEIQIGTLRTWNEPQMDTLADGTPRELTKLRMLLTANTPEHQLLPREYDLEILDQDVNNSFIFSEEDLPGYKNKTRSDAASAGIPLALLRSRGNGNGGSERPTYDRRSRFQPYYRKAIPSMQSFLTLLIFHETNLVQQRKPKSLERFDTICVLSHEIYERKRSSWRSAFLMLRTPKRSFKLSAETKLLPLSIPELRAPSVGEETSSYVYTRPPSIYLFYLDTAANFFTTEKCCPYYQTQEGRNPQGYSYSQEPASRSYFRLFPSVSVLVDEGPAAANPAAGFLSAPGPRGSCSSQQERSVC